ncbi:hypothetical protein Aau02nite_82700 [Amorphoplanes auranticolor]|uniref:Uncharacterized protein n=1 Tax=Actinoplanes auranticolor TaxID=47988 RepID=A0A919SWM6_9ACTN|nr:hypothetical protein Aau02nite_82700 [Actinoplanes auranticolor]
MTFTAAVIASRALWRPCRSTAAGLLNPMLALSLVARLHRRAPPVVRGGRNPHLRRCRPVVEAEARTCAVAGPAVEADTRTCAVAGRWRKPAPASLPTGGSVSRAPRPMIAPETLGAPGPPSVPQGGLEPVPRFEALRHPQIHLQQ